MTTKENEDRIGNYQFIKTIGKGTFGKVKLSIHLPTMEYVAIKILEKSRIQEKEELERIEKEIKYLKIFNHPNIIQIYEVISTKKNFYIVMEYVSGGELFNYIVDHEKLNEKEASFFFAQLMYGLKELDSKKICHRDIKPENLLLTEKKIIKIIDFGLSNEYKDYLSTQCGSPCYAAPEMIKGLKYSGLMIDLWACGIILFAMLCGYLPFDDKDNNILFRKILQCKLEFPDEKETHLSEQAKDLITKILNPNPLNRISLEETLSHPFLISGINEYKKEMKPIVFNQEKVIIDYMVNKLKYSNENQKIINFIKANKHNKYTTTYKLLKKKIIEGRFDYHYNINENINNTYISPIKNLKIKIKIQNKDDLDNNSNILDLLNKNANKESIKDPLRKGFRERVEDKNEKNQTHSFDSTKQTNVNKVIIPKDKKAIDHNILFTVNNNNNLLLKDSIKTNPLYQKLISNKKGINKFKRQIDTSISVEKRPLKRKKKIKIKSTTPTPQKYFINPFINIQDIYKYKIDRKKILYIPKYIINGKRGISEDKIKPKAYKNLENLKHRRKINNMNFKIENMRKGYALSPIPQLKEVIRYGLSSDKASNKLKRLKNKNIKKKENIQNINIKRINKIGHKQINSELDSNSKLYSIDNTPKINYQKIHIKKMINKNEYLINNKNKTSAKTPTLKRNRNLVHINNEEQHKKIRSNFIGYNYNTIQANKIKNHLIKENNNHINNNTLNTNIIYNNYIYHENNSINNNEIKTENNIRSLSNNNNKKKFKNLISNKNEKHIPLSSRVKPLNKRNDISNYHRNLNTINTTETNSYNKKINLILNPDIYNKNFLVTNTNLSFEQIKKKIKRFCQKNNYSYYSLDDTQYTIIINNINSVIIEVINNSENKIIKFYHNTGSCKITQENINKLFFEMCNN